MPEAMAAICRLLRRKPDTEAERTPAVAPGAPFRVGDYVLWGGTMQRILTIEEGGETIGFWDEEFDDGTPWMYVCTADLIQHQVAWKKNRRGDWERLDGAQVGRPQQISLALKGTVFGGRNPNLTGLLPDEKDFG